MSEFKTAADYIETVYGTRTFARALDCNDAMSIMDLMQDFSDYNSKLLIEELNFALKALKAVNSFGATKPIIERIEKTIQQATTIK